MTSVASNISPLLAEGDLESLVHVTWTGGVMSFDLPPWGRSVNSFLSVTSGSCGLAAMSAELVFRLAPVIWPDDLAGVPGRVVQMFRYQATNGWNVEWGYCGGCGWAITNVTTHIKAGKRSCSKCEAALSTVPCLAHHTYGTCPLCTFDRGDAKEHAPRTSQLPGVDRAAHRAIAREHRNDCKDPDCECRAA